MIYAIKIYCVSNLSFVYVYGVEKSISSEWVHVGVIHSHSEYHDDLALPF